MSIVWDEDSEGELREAFQFVSAKLKGKTHLEEKDIDAVLRHMCFIPGPGEAKKIIVTGNEGNEGATSITEDQFVAAMSTKLNGAERADEIIEAFSVFDKDGRGFVSSSDLRQVLTAMGDRLDEEQVEQMLRSAMGTGVGESQLNYAMFVRSVIKQ